MSTPRQLPTLLTEDEAAAYLKTSRAHVRKLRAQGRLGYFKVGKKPRFTHDHLLDYLAGKPRRTP